MLFLGLLFTPYLALANDPFDNTIFTFDNNVQTTEQLGTSPSQDITSQQDESVALDHPINTRYAITSYSLRGLIKSPNNFTVKPQSRCYFGYVKNIIIPT